MSRLWLLGLLLWSAVLVLACSPARAAEPALLLEMGFWKDQSAQSTLDQAQKQSFKPFSGEFSGGYTDGVHWLRIRLASSSSPIGLRLSPPWIDEITLFDPAQPGVKLTAGDRHPLGVTVEQLLGFVFVLPASSQARDILVRLRSTSSHRLIVQAMPADQLPAANSRVILWTSVYAALMAIILLALLSLWLVQPERVLGAYLIRHAAYTVYGVAFLGLPQMLLAGEISDAVLDLGFSWSVVAILPLALLFDLILLRGYRPRPFLFKALQVVTAASLVFAGLLLVGEVRLALQLTVQSILLITLLVFATALSTRPEPSVQRLLSKKVMMGYYGLVLSSLLLGLPGVLGWGGSEVRFQYLLILHGMVSGLVMTAILFVRGQRLFRTSQQMAWQLQRAQEEADLQRRRHREQSQFLHMLMHELKTPLAVVSLALGTRNNREENLALASRSVQDMKAILDRCIQADQLGQLSLQRGQDLIDLPATVARVAKDIPQLHERMRLQAAVDLPELLTDQQLLRIVVTNLLDNAQRYSDPLSPVEVSVRAASEDGQEGLQLSVCNAPGLAGRPDEQLLFSKYYRSTGAQRDSGSGLGLYLSQQLAQSLGGWLRYIPGPERLEFVFWVPCK